MRKSDAIFIFFSIASMTLGVFMPFVAESTRWVPRAVMLTLLFVSFLAVDGMDVWQNLKHFPGSVALLVTLKLLVMPVLCWAVFSLVAPEFALAAALLGGSAAAVGAPFYALLVQADFILTLVGLVATSLLLPFVLPGVLAFLHFLASGQEEGVIALAVWPMVINLATMTILPFVVAQFLRKNKPKVTETILKQRLTIFIVATCLANIGIFSQYSGEILHSPEYLVKALGYAFFISAVLFIFSAVFTYWLHPAKQLSCVISCVAMNNVLILIISVEFFSMTEAIFAAMYTVPFLLSLTVYRVLGKLRGYNPV